MSTHGSVRHRQSCGERKSTFLLLVFYGPDDQIGSGRAETPEPTRQIYSDMFDGFRCSDARRISKVGSGQVGLVAEQDVATEPVDAFCAK